jgi:DNA invertase Pin-like site-specific DNA recombinase
MFAKGRGYYTWGEGHPMARLTEEQVREIRRLRADGWSAAHLAVAFGIGLTQCRRIVAREQWQHIT